MKMNLYRSIITLLCALFCFTTGRADESPEAYEWSKQLGEELQTARVFWDFIEGGAPLIVLGDRIAETDALKGVQIAFTFADLPLGEYEYVKPSHSLFQHNDQVKAVPERQVFHFQQKHLTLLRHMSVRHSFKTEDGEILVGIDPKRPYGDFSYFEAEMALILKRPTTRNEKNQVELNDELEAEMTTLHNEMTLAVQVFLQNAKLEPSRYRDLGYGVWEKI